MSLGDIGRGALDTSPKFLFPVLIVVMLVYAYLGFTQPSNYHEAAPVTTWR